MKLDDFITCGDSGYESPITVIAEQMRIEQEENIFKAIKRFNINVNKEELIKALDYDRNQYAKGYEEAKRYYQPFAEKLQKIEEICKEAFSYDSGDRDRNIMHKAQALCDIYALFLYDGATLPQIEENKQISIDDLL